MIWVEIEFPNYKVLLCVVYRSPGATQSFWQNFEYSIEEAFNYTTNVIITGDLNIDLLVENNNSLSNIINVFYLQNVIHEPTRINQNTGNGTLLDPKFQITYKKRTSEQYGGIRMKKNLIN